MNTDSWLYNIRVHHSCITNYDLMTEQDDDLLFDKNKYLQTNNIPHNYTTVEVVQTT